MTVVVIAGDNKQLKCRSCCYSTCQVLTDAPIAIKIFVRDEGMPIGISNRGQAMVGTLHRHRL